MADLKREVLPKLVLPSHYLVNLTPNFDDFSFAGSVDITVKFNGPTNTIAVNTNELKIHSAALKNVTMKTQQVFNATDIAFNQPLEQTTFTFPSEFPAGTEAVLSIQFQGTMNDRMVGFYRSSYTDKDGKKKHMGVTQFEATDARRAFPCWDEPAVKATFDIVLNVQSNHTALSNMNVISEKPHPSKEGFKEVKFATSPVMSTYLVAWAVGDFEYIETTTSPSCKYLPTPVQVRVYTLKGSVEQGKFALGVAAKVLEYFSEIFQIPYPLPKLDMIAVPDFSAGAMENWGLVTYRTVYMLYDEKTSSARSKQNIAYVVSHELAHQWFGNLVTMDWWTDLWLNEGFATYVGWLAVDHLFPEWDVWTQFVMDEMQRALSLDGLKSSHPIEVEVKSPSEIGQIFDAISYSKGASVIRMLSNWLGLEKFLEGVRAYLKKYEYKNAVTADLWNSLSAVSGVNVAEFMHLWTKQTGYPVVTIKEEANRQLKLTQSRFLSSGKVTPEDDQAIWWCPLSIFTSSASANSPDTKQILKTRSDTFSLPAKGDSSGIDFYKLNLRQTNFYRVNYPSHNLENLGKAIVKGNILSVSDRVGVVTDVFALAGAGVSSTVDCLRLLKYFESETEYIALNEVATRLSTLKTIWAFEPEEVSDRLKAFTRNIFSKQAKTVGWEYKDDEGHLKSMLRTLVIGAAGINGDKEVIEQAKTRFNAFISGDEQKLHPNIRGTVYAIVLKNSSNPKEDFDKIVKIYETTTNVDQKLAALSALGRVEDPELLKHVLKYAMDEDNVRPQDFIYPLGSVASNPKGRKLAWEFVKTNWEKLEERFVSTLSLLGRCVTSTTQDYATEEFAKEVESFFKDKNTKPIDRPLEQSLEKIRSQAAWLNRDRDAVAKWLKENVSL
ncbi:aminopeptidase [Paraphysoderma sedebokerense]|nr:aminopeptidase [Paraphysoderma sedebokerense]